MSFYLVQNLQYLPGRKANPFGYGRLADYELDYMGAAEYEWGAIPDASKRLEGAEIKLDEVTINGAEMTFAYRAEDGEPYEAFEAWIKSGFRGKNVNASEIERRFNGEHGQYDRTDIWWALEENVMFCFNSDEGPEGAKSHLHHLFQAELVQ